MNTRTLPAVRMPNVGNTCSSREVRDQVPADVYEAQVALMAMSVDRDAIVARLHEARRAAATTC